jgi:hypothetical protein
MTPRSSQRKGKQGELELADKLSSLFGVQCRRMASAYLPGLIAPDVYGLPGIHIEVKRRERVTLHAAIRQARHDAVDRTPIVAHRGNRHGWLVTCELQDLPTLAAKLSAIGKTTSSDAVVIGENNKADNRQRGNEL